MTSRTGWGLVALGAGLMFMLDPQTGRRRRAVARDKSLRIARRTAERTAVLARQAANRARGVVAETRARLEDEEWVDDSVLVARVRSELGRVVSHPGSIHIDAVDGIVTIRGPIFTWEAEAALGAARATRGVIDVEDQMTRHDRPGSVPGLQEGH